MQARLHDPRRRKERPSFTGVVPDKVARLVAGRSSSRSRRCRRTTSRRWRASRRSTRRWSSARATTCAKNGFEKVVIGLSGGVDSSSSPSSPSTRWARRTSSACRCRRASRRRAAAATRRPSPRTWASSCSPIPIEEAFDGLPATCSPEPFAGTEFGIAEENLQARIRGNILMALSNKFGWLVLTTGNKSEMATGYSTLYGDMAGGFAVIKDVPKTLVYKLAEYRNSRGDKPVIPQASSTRRPRPSCGRTRRTRTRCRPTRCSTRSSRPTSRRTRAWPTSWPRASTRRRSSASSRWSTATSTSDGRRRPASRSRRAPSAATAACPSPIATAAGSRARCHLLPWPSRTPASSRLKQRSPTARSSLERRAHQSGDERAPPEGVDVRDLRGLIVAPGFIDLHVHGGGGFSLVDGDAAQLRGYARWAATRGVTGFLATLVPDTRRRMVRNHRFDGGGFRRRSTARDRSASTWKGRS